MSKENNNIPTLEEYIVQQIAAKKAAALDKSRTRNLPAYPLKNNILSEEEWLVNLTKRLLEVNNSSAPEWMKNILRTSIDGERNAGYYNYVGSNCIGPTCTKTAGDNYGIDVIGSLQFRENPGQYGFKQIDNKLVKPGDIVIDVENGKGRHTMMLDSNGKEGLRFNHSNGGFGPENIRKGARYPFKGLMESYTYTGTPADSILWTNQYNQIYGMAKGGIFGIPYLKKGSGIHIKKKNRGKFTEYCGGKVTDECISRAKKSKNPKLRKRATFAANSRRWSKKHLWGGIVNFIRNAILGAAMADLPAVMTASGWRLNEKGDYVQDLLNNPNVEKLRNNLAIIAGTADGKGGLDFGIKSMKDLINTNKIRKLFDKCINKTNLPKKEPILNIGWGPKQTIKVIHASKSPGPLRLFYNKRWDAIEEDANPFGVWFQGKWGLPRTIYTNSLPGKAEKAEKVRKMFADRPYKHQGDLVLEKPITTVGEVPDRSVLSYLAEKMGSDGIIYNNVYDNGYDNNLVIFSFKNLIK